MRRRGRRGVRRIDLHDVLCGVHQTGDLVPPDLKEAYRPAGELPGKGHRVVLGVVDAFVTEGFKDGRADPANVVAAKVPATNRAGRLAELTGLCLSVGGKSEDLLQDRASYVLNGARSVRHGTGDNG